MRWVSPGQHRPVFRLGGGLVGRADADVNFVGAGAGWFRRADGAVADSVQVYHPALDQLQYGLLLEPGLSRRANRGILLL